MVLALTSAALGVGLYVFWPTDLPSVKALEEYAPSEGSKVYTDDDELLTEFQAERRIFVPLPEIPELLRNAIIAMEDSRFYSHFGVDLRGIVRAAYANFRHGRIVEGGSTITQQLAKMLFLTPDRSFSRKLKEAFLALELEKRYSKDRLLELYVNHIYLGHGAYGVESASRTYFARSARELTLPQAALLAALAPAPARYSPFDHPAVATRRRARVLQRMVEEGYITPEAAREIRDAPLDLATAEPRRRTGRYFVEYLARVLESKLGSDLLYRGGLSIYTTLNPLTQRYAEAALRDGLREIARRHPARVASRDTVAVTPEPEGAVVVIEPQTGYIRALVGGSDFSRSQYNRAVRARRQPGSAFKPFVYIAALEAGRTPADLIDDSAVSYTASGGETWQPANYDGEFRGLITLQEALEESVNVATVRLLEQIGVGKAMEVARRLGIESPLRADLTLALGSSEVTLLELTSAYAALANQGVWMEPIPVRYITDGSGRLLEENIPQGREAVRPEIAYAITHMLQGAVQRGTAKRARPLGRPLAAKTGTTNDFSNAWFVGYTPTLTAGVWVGHDRVRTLGEHETGARAALPIWLAVMRESLRATSAKGFPIPANVVMARVDMTTGHLANPACPKPVVMAFVSGTEPSRFCPFHPPAAPSPD